MRAIDRTDGLKLNYYALCLAICKKISVTQACLRMGLHIKQRGEQKRTERFNLSDKELDKAIRLKRAGLTWKEIAEKDEYDMLPGTLWQKVKKYMGDDWKNRGW